ncbi:MAG: hypothetical protein IH908_03300 [Proteobacteria bacterium]|nr:hypothetical protein [Pseudomonadota bacterium]
MIKPRQGEEQDNACVRTQRYFETNEGWFLRTREGIPVGPYKTAFDVELAASLLSPKLDQVESASEVVSTIETFLHDPVYGSTEELPTAKPAQAKLKAPAKASLPVIGYSLKRGCMDFIERTIYLAQSARSRISMFGSSRSQSDL